MLVNMNEVLKPAQKGKYAVGLFNAVNMELARGILRSLTKKPMRDLLFLCEEGGNVP